MPGCLEAALLRGCGPLGTGAEPVSGLASLGAGTTMRTRERPLALGLGASVTRALEILFGIYCANPEGRGERLSAGIQRG